MKTVLLWIALSCMSASVESKQVCKNAAQVDPTATFKFGDSIMKCSDIVALVGTWPSADPAKVCQGGAVKANALSSLEIYAGLGCCKDKLSLCSDYLPNHCDGGTMTQTTLTLEGTTVVPCSYMAAMIPKTTPDKTACFKGLGDDGKEKTPTSFMMGMLASSCCSSKKSICDKYTMNMCKDPTKMLPDVKVDMDKYKYTCKVLSSMAAAFTPSQANCAVKGDGKMNMGQLLEKFAPYCCSDKKSACSGFVTVPAAAGAASGTSQNTTSNATGNSTATKGAASGVPGWVANTWLVSAVLSLMM